MAGESSQMTIGDYFTLQRGTTYKRSLLGKPGPVLLGLATIQRNGGFRSDSLRTYGGESPENLLVHPGELYVSLKDVTQTADLLGAVARLPIGYDPGRLTQDTVKLKPKSKDVPIDYVYWLLRAPQYRNYCRAHATGTTNLGLPREDFLTFPIPDQTPGRRQIVKALAALDDKIDLNRRMNETLEAMARALFKSWFVDFDPVRAKAEGRDCGLPQSLANLFPAHLVHSELGEIPEGWEAGTVAGLSDLNPEVWTKRTRPAEIRYVDLSNTKRGRIEAIAPYTAARAPSRAQRVLRPGDTLVGTVRPGNASFALVSEPGLTGSTGFAVLRPQEVEYAEFVYLAATSASRIDALAHFADGAAYPAVRSKVVAATPVVRPDDKVLMQFSAAARPQLGRIANSERESRTLAALRDLLLPKLISGEIHPLDAEKVVGAVT